MQYAFWLLNGDVNSAGDYQSVADELILKANSAVDGGWKNDKWVMLAEIGAGDAWYAEKGQDVLVSAAPV
ncbi:MAG: hypothetical protein KQI81_23325, partial [Deltaproteobacteria bacterium]|nr:hypothetical protein [Deltaproteobacteria bacterium]